MAQTSAILRITPSAKKRLESYCKQTGQTPSAVIETVIPDNSSPYEGEDDELARQMEKLDAAIERDRPRWATRTQDELEQLVYEAEQNENPVTYPFEEGMARLRAKVAAYGAENSHVQA